MFRRKPKPITLADVSSRLRGFILDSQVQDGHELAVMLGCSPISDDVAEREEEASDDRVAKISALIPLLYAFAHALAEASIERQKMSLEGSEKVPAEVWMYSRKLIEQVAVAALIGSTSQLVDMGLVDVPKRFRRLFSE
jgi:hypothetical protein